jgi:hypothetical protein
VLAKRDVDTSYLEMFSGTTYKNGAFLRLDSMGGANAGQFRLQTGDGTTNKVLNGKPDGTLTWDGKHVVRIAAQSNGVNGYRKYTDGLIIQWGTYTNTSSSGTITLPLAFSNTNYSAVITQMGNSTDTGGWGAGVALNPTKTITTITYSVQESCKITWIAIGY